VDILLARKSRDLDDDRVLQDPLERNEELNTIFTKRININKFSMCTMNALGLLSVRGSILDICPSRKLIRQSICACICSSKNLSDEGHKHSVCVC